MGLFGRVLRTRRVSRLRRNRAGLPACRGGLELTRRRQSGRSPNRSVPGSSAPSEWRPPQQPGSSLPAPRLWGSSARPVSASSMWPLGCAGATWWFPRGSSPPTSTPGSALSKRGSSTRSERYRFLTVGSLPMSSGRTSIRDTSAVALSSVDYSTGFRADLDAMRELAGDALLVVDAIQGFGAFPFLSTRRRGGRRRAEVAAGRNGSRR